MKSKNVTVQKNSDIISSVIAEIMKMTCTDDLKSKMIALALFELVEYD